MKVVEFIEMYKAKKIANTAAVGEWIRKTLEVKEYVPFVEKQSIAQVVLASCSQMDNGVVTIDSVHKYMIFTIVTLSTYTNLEFDGDENDLAAYDMLCSCMVGDCTMLDTIIKTFEKEYLRCNEILNMTTADLLAENHIEKQIGKFLAKLSTKIDELGNSIAEQIGSVGIDVDQLDIEKIANVIAKIK